MEKWEIALNKFLEDYKDKDYIIGAILCGSYLTNTYNAHSDIDIHLIIDDNQKWQERGNAVVDGFIIEYFLNPVSKLKKYFENDYNGGDYCTASMIGNGKILFSKGNNVQELQETAKDYLSKELKEVDENKKLDMQYHIWDYYDELTNLYNNDDDTYYFVHYLLIDKIVELYHMCFRIPLIPVSKINKIYNDKAYALKYNIKSSSDEEYIRLIMESIKSNNKEEMFSNITKLKEYVTSKTGDFDIGKFKMRRELV